MKKALVITSRNPYPISGGDKKRIDSIINSLDRNNFEVTLVTHEITIFPTKIFFQKSFKPFLKKEVKVYVSYLELFLNLLKALISDKPFQYFLYYSPKLKKFLKKNNENFEICIYHLLRTSIYKKSVNAEKHILEMTDSLSLNYAREIESFRSSIYLKGIPFFLILEIERKKLLKMEIMAAQEFDSVILVSGIDKTYLENKSKKIHKIPYIIIPLLGEVKNPSRFYEKENKYLFLGQLSYRPNLKALNWLLNEIHPEVTSRLPQVKLVIIGSNPPKNFSILEKKYKGVKFIGFVEKLEPHFFSSVLSVAPMKTGAGMQNKVIDSLSHGIPIVTTSIGLGDIKLKVDDEIFVSDNEKDFADRIIEIFQNKEKYISLDQKYKNAIKDNYGEEIFDSKLKEIF